MTTWQQYRADNNRYITVITVGIISIIAIFMIILSIITIITTIIIIIIAIDLVKCKPRSPSHRATYAPRRPGEGCQAQARTSRAEAPGKGFFLGV